MSFKDLPPELIVKISESLSSRDKLRLRLVCKYTERCTSRDFKRRFRKIGFMVTPLSLDVMKGISRRPELAAVVEHIWFNPDLFAHLHHFGSDGDLDRSRLPPLTASQHKAYETAVFAQTLLLNTGILADGLSRDMADFPRLRTLGMRKGPKFRPFGRPSLQKQSGYDPRILGDMAFAMEADHRSLSSTTRLLVYMTAALSRFRNRVERLYIDCSELDEINPTLMKPATLRAAYGNVRNLELNVFGPRAVNHKHGASGSSSKKTAWEQTLEDFGNLPGVQRAGEETFAEPECERLGSPVVEMLSAMPRLESLAFCISPLRYSPSARCMFAVDEAGDPLPWGYKWAAFACIARGVSMTNLTRLKLESINTTAVLLNTFLQSTAPRLQILKLRRIMLLSRDLTNGHKIQPLLPWRLVFSTLAIDYPKLSCIFFDVLSVWKEQSVVFDGSAEAVDDLEWDADEPDREVLQRLDDCVPANVLHTVDASGVEAVQRKLKNITKRHWYRAKSEVSAVAQDDIWYSDTSDEEL
jgi:hypothetical protein